MPACVAPQFCSVAKTCIDEGTCLEDGDCSKGNVCDPMTKACVPGGMCGQFEAKIEAVPPNLLVVLDRSCSMTGMVGAQTKWQIAVAALNQLTTTYNAQIRFGLTLFPDKTPENCEQAAIPIPTAPGNEMAIQTLLTAALVTGDMYFPNAPCVTNIDTAMQQTTTDLALMDMTRENYVLLMTDGAQSSNCTVGGGDAGTLAAIQGLATQGIRTFVLGFGAGVDVDQLNQFAVAGGVPSAGANQFYDAGDQPSLDAALDIIAKQTLGCTFNLDMTPPDPDEIYVFFDNNPVAADSANGWSYDVATNTVTFNGTSCDQLKNETVSDVDVVFGCDEPTPD
jgi:hypothetical protein